MVIANFNLLLKRVFFALKIQKLLLDLKIFIFFLKKIKAFNKKIKKKLKFYSLLNSNKI